MSARYTHDKSLGRVTLMALATTILCSAVATYIIYNAVLVPSLNGLEEIIRTEATRLTAHSVEVAANSNTNSSQDLQIEILTKQVQELQKQIDLLHEMQSEK